jgi:molybdate transport system permease protein
LRYAGWATLFSLIVAWPLAWLLARREYPGRDLLEACANLPLLMPPTVLAYYLLAALGRWHLVFHWRAAVAVSAVYTLPLLLRWPDDGRFENAARALGAGEWRILWRITLPLAWRGLLGAVVAGFARAAADFGLTVMVAGQGSSGWLLLPIGGMALAALYGGKRLRREWVAA